MLKIALIGAAVVAAGGAAGFALGSAAGGGDGDRAAVTTPTTSTTASSSALASRLPASVYSGCVATGADTVRCSSPRPGVDELLVREVDDVRAEFAAGYGDKPDGKCGSWTGRPASGLRSTWGGQQPLACYLNSKGAAVVLWGDVDSDLLIAAVRTDGDARAAFTWWTEAVKVALP